MLSAFNHIEPTEQTALAERLAACPDSPITVTLGGGAPVVDEHGHEPPARATGTLNSPGRSSASQPRAARRFAFDRTPSTLAGTGSSPMAAAGCWRMPASFPL